ncbi:DNA topoisomerase 2 [Zancudomyces culisetae]|uniref:DNA topoisomerase 2 n=1 Tax=Zancudomyces culisetae TaxID=1213189 RepID=A0A1R1PX04_ZANCU|nr:DNA topoisomerase 2 [Zancudomyces culisetae]|eukprot:OMH85453.1 DNA topoisomerase 2 [Zancudomyces culisetae]
MTQMKIDSFVKRTAGTKRQNEDSDYDGSDLSPVARPNSKRQAPKKSVKDDDSGDDYNGDVVAKPQAKKSNSKANGGKAVEEIYQKKSQLEHILLRPDTYIGSVEPVEEQMWVYNKETERMERKMIKYTPGLYKIVDEILVNAADNKIRDPDMDFIKVTINQEEGEISVQNDGKGIPVEIHGTEKVYVPEMIFGHLLTSSNYNDDEKKVTGGRNGYGAKLCNIFSTEFIIETADLAQGKKYKQVFKDNMSIIGKPSITKMTTKTEYTKVTFKPDFSKFKMEKMDSGITELITRRVYDLAGCVSGIKVYLNGERIKIRNFKDYVDLYVQPPKREIKVKEEGGTEGEENGGVSAETESLKGPIQTKTTVVYQRFSERWEVGFAVSDGTFQQVSFVNSVNTVKGGTHVNYITDQIVNKVIANVKKKNKNSQVKPYQVKGHMWVFVNTLVENPTFDSQTKETMTLRASAFGSKCEIDDDFMKKIFRTELTSNVLSFVKFKEQQSMKKTDGSKSSRITGIVKLEDANKAGTRGSKDCTLILTEGDSAKTLAISGMSVVGRDYYGVFPLRGKLLNVRDATNKQVTDNAEINYIKQILGLKHGQEYVSADSLRYGHLMVMADQDVDGSHIKGLIINFFDSFFPSLLKVPGFLLDFMTPVVKATKRNQVKSFYSEPEFNEWRRTIGDKLGEWTIKYYKGLGTSSAKEAKEYFGNLEYHRKNFLPASDSDRKLIDLAFSKSRADDRKEWIAGYEPGTYLDTSMKQVPVTEFINKELVLYSIADTARSIPSVVDGLKPGQRKIIYGCFKRNLKSEIKVAALAGYVSEQTAYHHGEQSLTQSIVVLAQDFVGSNNLNLLEPRGQFGTRLQGGKDSASARYIFTTLSQITRTLFNSSDNVLLDHVEDDGKLVEPVWYIPVVPVILINGAEGIGTGWSTNIPNFNPVDIVNNLRLLMDGKDPVPMTPWYRGFNGVIENVSPNKYKCTGIVEQIDDNTLHITELPVRVWTQSYKEQLESWRTGTDKTEAIIKDYKEYHTDTKVDFVLTLTDAQMQAALKEGLESRFKLSASISTSNMVCFDREGRIKKYPSPEAILTEFYPLRLRYYQLRKDALVQQMQEEYERLDNKARFVLEIIQKKLVVQNKKKDVIVQELFDKGFKQFPPKGKSPSSKSSSAQNADSKSDSNGSDGTNSDTDQDNNGSSNPGAPKAKDYDYLLSMPIWNLTAEKVEKLIKERDDCLMKLDTLLAKTPKDLWNSDLDDFLSGWEAVLQNHENNERDELLAKKKHARGGKRGTTAPAPRKKAIAASTTAKTTKTNKSAAATTIKTESKPSVSTIKSEPNADTYNIVSSDDDDTSKDSNSKKSGSTLTMSLTERLDLIRKRKMAASSASKTTPLTASSTGSDPIVQVSKPKAATSKSAATTAKKPPAKSKRRKIDSTDDEISADELGNYSHEPSPDDDGPAVRKTRQRRTAATRKKVNYAVDDTSESETQLKHKGAGKATKSNEDDDDEDEDGIMSDDGSDYSDF